MRKDIILIAVSLFLSLLSADILYLYHGDKWVEPNDLIRHAELLMLCFFVLAGIGIALWRMIVLWRNK